MPKESLHKVLILQSAEKPASCLTKLFLFMKIVTLGSTDMRKI